MESLPICIKLRQKFRADNFFTANVLAAKIPDTKLTCLNEINKVKNLLLYLHISNYKQCYKFTYNTNILLLELYNYFYIAA